jgi:hypothetical protein
LRQDIKAKIRIAKARRQKKSSSDVTMNSRRQLRIRKRQGERGLTTGTRNDIPPLSTEEAEFGKLTKKKELKLRSLDLKGQRPR